MLDKGGYPYHLKRRIRGGQGHLSNKQALELFVADIGFVETKRYVMEVFRARAAYESLVNSN